jgi:hypothetical protein
MPSLSRQPLPRSAFGRAGSSLRYERSFHFSPKSNELSEADRGSRRWSSSDFRTSIYRPPFGSREFDGTVRG